MIMVANAENIREKAMPFLEHIHELKRRLLWVAGTILAGVIIFFIFYHPVIEFLLIPARGLLSPSAKPIVTGPMDFLNISWKLGIITGLILGLPMILYQTVKFISPAVSRRTTLLLVLVFPVSIIMFAGGVLMGYFLVLPVMLHFVLTFGSDLVTPQIRLEDYLNLIILLEAGIGLAFETPIVMFVLAKLGLVSYKGFRKLWRWVVVIAFIIGAIFDPTLNPFDQVVVAGTIIALYWVGILLAWLVQRNKISRVAATM